MDNKEIAAAIAAHPEMNRALYAMPRAAAKDYILDLADLADEVADALEALPAAMEARVMGWAWDAVRAHTEHTDADEDAELDELEAEMDRLDAAPMGKIAALIADAAAAGMAIHASENGTMDVVAARHAGTGRVLRGLRVYPNGTATDITVRLDVAKGIRSTATMRRVLGL